jgi:DNA-binding MarR family transcriptional regulator
MAVKVRRSTRAEQARAAWQRMFEILMASTPGRERSLARRGLTPNDARALWALDARTGRPIGELAARWGCDPSNATWIIDRLERAGLALREVSPNDRRVKLVRLTAAGAHTMRDLLREFHEPPPELRALSLTDLRALRAILERAKASVSAR